MRKWLLCAAALVGSSSLSGAADLPKDISAEDRTEFITDWQRAYKKHRTGLVRDVEDAGSLLKFPATKADGAVKLAAAKKGLADLDAVPWKCPGSPAKEYGYDLPKRGDIGTVFFNQSIATAVTEDGVLVEGVIATDPSRVRRVLVASSLKLPKGKKDPPVTLPGLWYCAGTTEVKGREVPVLYRFELKKDDFPKDK